MKFVNVFKIILVICFICSLSFYGGNLVAKAAAAYAWNGHWSNQSSIYYVNNISTSTRLGSLVIQLH